VGGISFAPCFGFASPNRLLNFGPFDFWLLVENGYIFLENFLGLFSGTQPNVVLCVSSEFC
jgi:hypothetical protein